MILCTLTNRCLILTLQVLDRLHLSPPDGIISQNRIHEEGTAYLVADPEVRAPASRCARAGDLMCAFFQGGKLSFIIAVEVII